MIVFEDPPRSRNGPRPTGYTVRDSKTAKYERVLRARPGEWAVWAVSARSSAESWYAKKRLGPGFESTRRCNDDGSYKVWVRFVGGER